MRFLPSLQQKDAATLRRATASPHYVLRASPYHGSWSVERAVGEGFERVIWVFRAVDVIASNYARLPVLLRQGAEDGPERDGDPLLYRLNRHANPWEAAAMFRYALMAQLLLSKRGAFVETVWDRMGRLAGLFLLPPAVTEPVKDARTFVSGYKVTIDGVVETVPTHWPNGRPRVLWFRKRHPTDPYQSVTPLEAAGVSIDMDWFARLYNRAFLQNDGRPGGILGIKGSVDPEDKKELKERFSGGPAQAGRVSVLSVDDLSWADTAITPRDAQFVEILKMSKTDVLDAFGVDESLIGQTSGRTWNNARQAKLNFWEETMPPWLDLMGAGFDAVTTGGVDDQLFVVHDVSGVPVIQGAQREKEAHLAKMVEMGLMTQDEARVEMGRKAFDVPSTRALLRRTSLGVGAWAPGDEPEEPASPVEADEAEEVPELRAAALRSGALPTGPGDPRWERRWAKAVEALLDRHLSRQEQVVLDRLRGRQARKGTVLWRPRGDRQVEAKALLDRGRWDAELAAEFRPIAEAALEEAGAGWSDGERERRQSRLLEVNSAVEAFLDVAVKARDGEAVEDVAGRVRQLYEAVRGRLAQDAAAVVEGLATEPAAA